MESISNALGNNSRLLAQLQRIEEQVNANPYVRALKQKYPHAKFRRNELAQFATEAMNCRNCPGLDQCKNTMKGHKSFYKDEPALGLVLKHLPCNELVSFERQQTINRHVKSHNVPENILRSTFETLDKEPARADAIKAAMRFCVGFERGKTTKGLYFHGLMGVGKSAIAGAMTQELAKRGVDVMMVYVPEFLGEIKSAIKSGTVEEKLDAMKEVSVLILDDIGAEQITTWTRDEVIGAVLQSRMERLPTVYTSNLTTHDLTQHLARAKDEKVPNLIKAQRLMERIDPFVQQITIGGRNRRRMG